MNEGINVSEMSGGGAMMVLLGTESHAISSLRLNLEHNLSSIFLVEKSLIHHVGSPFSLLLLWYQPQNWERDAAIKFGFELRSWIEREATKGNVLSSQLYCQRCLISSIDEFNMIILNIYGYMSYKKFSSLTLYCDTKKIYHIT